MSGLALEPPTKIDIKELRVRQTAFSAAIVLDRKWKDKNRFPKWLMADDLQRELEMSRATAYRYVNDYIVVRCMARKIGAC